MFQIVFGRKFLRAAKKLDSETKSKLKNCLDILLKDPFHPLLHTKPLTGELSGKYSFRIGREYRVIFNFLSEKTIQLIDVGNRRDIYK